MGWTMHILKVDGVTHYYKQFLALNDISFEISDGITALLGNNGAGKTTLINIIVGLINCTKGRIIFDDLDRMKTGRAYRNCIGFLPQECGFYDNYSGYQFLQYMGYMKNVDKRIINSRIEHYLTVLGLWEHRNKTIKNYSGGMKHRLGIAQAMLNEPSLLILDEPTTGLDYSERKAFKKMITEYAVNNIVIISTHILSDVEDVAGHVIIIKDGKLAYDAPVESNNLSSQYALLFDGDAHEI